MRHQSLPFWLLSGVLVMVFLTGGGARADVQSLVILRPLAVLACGAALWTLRVEQVRKHRWLFALMAAAMILPLLQLMPLPTSLWSALPGREVIAAVDRAAGLGGVARPLSMVPEGTWNAFFALFVPLAVLLLGVQLSSHERQQLLPLLLGLGLLSGVIGVFQAIGDPNGPLYLYRITNNGSSVGLFSNRNHQANLLAALFPMVAVYASFAARHEERTRLKTLAAIGAGALLVPLLLVTGSRAGLVLGIAGIAAAALLYRKPQDKAPRRRGKTLDLRLPLIALGVVALGGVTLLSSRAESLNRLTAPDQIEDLRFKVWGPILDSARAYFPAGSGLGTFVEVHRIDEPDAVLRPTYLNHAHNDWLELFLTAGLPGLVLAALGVGWIAMRAFGAFRAERGAGSGVVLARLGAVIAGLLMIGSMVDYPLRTPSLAALFMVAMLWLSSVATSRLSS